MRRRFYRRCSSANLATIAHSATPVLRENADRGGLEIHFPAKPGEGTLAALKVNGWRWNPASACWWTKNTPEARTYVEQLLGIAAIAPIEPVIPVPVPAPVLIPVAPPVVPPPPPAPFNVRAFKVEGLDDYTPAELMKLKMGLNMAIDAAMRRKAAQPAAA